MYLEIGFINKEKKKIEVSSLEEGLAIITDFNLAREEKTIEIMSNKYCFSFMKNKVLYIELKEGNVSILDK